MSIDCSQFYPGFAGFGGYNGFANYGYGLNGFNGLNTFGYGLGGYPAFGGYGLGYRTLASPAFATSVSVNYRSPIDTVLETYRNPSHLRPSLTEFPQSPPP